MASFPREHVARKDKEAQEKGEDKWIPPIMVSWDTDSIDPNAFPCTITQEANGLSSEEYLAFSDFLAGAYANNLRKPLDKSAQRLNLQTSVKLLQDMIVRISKPEKNILYQYIL